MSFIKIILLNTCCYFSLNTTIAQNLVVNGSFEDTIKCPDISWAIIDTSVTYWKTPTNHGGSADHFGTCSTPTTQGLSIPSNWLGYQDTCTGNFYAGIFVYAFASSDLDYNSREYITGQFSNSLQENFCYKISFKYSLAEGYSQFGIKNFGVYFSDSVPLNNAQVYNFNNLNYIPQIEIGQWLINDTDWVKIERFYTAEGGENYLTLGNFNDNDNTDTYFVRNNPQSFNTTMSYIYIDDVIVEEVPFQTLEELNLGGDTILCEGEELTFNNILPDSTVYVWNQLSNDTAFTIDSSGQYILEAYNGCSYTTDTINVEFVDPKVDLGEDKIVCKREEVILANADESTNHPEAEFQWYKETNQLSTEQQLKATEKGVYSLVANIGHCQDSDTVQVKYEIPENSIFQIQNTDTTFCVSGILDATSTEWNDKYLWKTNEETQTIEITETGTYEVYAENECTEATSTFNVKVEQLDEGLNNYNIFSPNGDFINDNFTIYEGNSEEYQIHIYNRWGKLVWQTDDPTNHWSANGINDGTYFYQLSFRNCAGEIIEQKGSVDVKR